MRVKSVAMLFLALALLAIAAPARAGRPPAKACPAGFNLGAMTFAQRLQLPKLQAALADGVTTIEQVQAVDAFIDMNGNGVLCVQDIPQRGNAAPASGSMYALVLVDDNAAVRP